VGGTCEPTPRAQCTINGIVRAAHAGSMLSLAAVDTARLTSLATGQGGIPTGAEWPIVLALLAILAFAGSRILMSIGLSKLEAIGIAAVAPLAVFIDAPSLPRTSPAASFPPPSR